MLVEAMELDGDKAEEIAGSLPLLRLRSGVMFVIGHHPTVAVWRLVVARPLIWTYHDTEVGMQ